MKRLFLFVTVVFLARALPAGAAPAPWYTWQSATGDRVCAQTSPGSGWVRLEVAYVDSRCQKRKNKQ